MKEYANACYSQYKDAIKSFEGKEIQCLFIESGIVQGIKGRLRYSSQEGIVIDNIPKHFCDEKDHSVIYGLFDNQTNILYKNEQAPNYLQENLDVLLASSIPEEPLPDFEDTFNKLIGYIGDSVVYTYWNLGEESEELGTLDLVIPYRSAEFDEKEIDFVGYNTAIERIMTLDGRVIFENPRVKGYQGQEMGDIQALIAAQEDLLGKSIAKKDLEEGQNLAGGSR